MGNHTRRTRSFRKGGKPCGCQGGERRYNQCDRGRPRYDSFTSCWGLPTEKFRRSILRCDTSVVINWGAITKSHFTYEWRPRRPRLVVCRGDIDCLRTEVSVGFVLTLFDNYNNNQLTLGLFPTRMFLNRGNHEAKEMNRTYGFEGEAKHKHGEQTYKVWNTWPHRWACFSVIFLL